MVVWKRNALKRPRWITCDQGEHKHALGEESGCFLEQTLFLSIHSILHSLKIAIQCSRSFMFMFGIPIVSLLPKTNPARNTEPRARRLHFQGVCVCAAKPTKRTHTFRNQIKRRDMPSNMTATDMTDTRAHQEDLVFDNQINLTTTTTAAQPDQTDLEHRVSYALYDIVQASLAIGIWIWAPLQHICRLGRRDASHARTVVIYGNSSINASLFLGTMTLKRI